MGEGETGVKKAGKKKVDRRKAEEYCTERLHVSQVFRNHWRILFRNI